jgi:transcriptional regulator with XRE-family HTH domain
MKASDAAEQLGGAVMSLGRRITELRLKTGESLQQVADAVQVSKAHIWELEKGRTDNPSMGLVTRLADHFGVSVSYLVGEQVDAPDAEVKLSRMFRRAQNLDEKELAILDDLMNSLLKRRDERGGG